MRTTRFLLVAASLIATACASDGSTSPKSNPVNDTRLAAATLAPTAAVNDPTVTMQVSVTSALPESVSAGVCAQTVEARAVTGTAWSDVSSVSSVCSALAVVLLPGGTANLSASGDQAKIRAAAGAGASTVVLRAKILMAGASTTYQVSSNEVTWKLP
jgi:hypothetical protein